MIDAIVNVGRELSKDAQGIGFLIDDVKTYSRFRERTAAQYQGIDLIDLFYTHGRAQ